ncbi:G patch domain-containing protein 1 homolog [Contarinia nasturtii]|uniref:G patch domain-containing protein 1 homolog n=1 Tax=Contarinia nasturtii TaxID=265458 RepID=UPI0012D3D65A|nr:G patch domain-containing protein 1 homolog [Contarinia nasturtii]
MSSDDEDQLCRFGTPLDPIEEDEIPKTKKITLADQIATDSNGKRRFHGAFTGGFSAGFWNTVGSREGWLPSEFKSSRSEKAERRTQQASDFMDDEDMSEFGIAPQRIQTTKDFGPSENRERNKRKLQSDLTQGPIPGVPVLELVLESCHDKAAVRLLKQMDKRYAVVLAAKAKKSKKRYPEDDTMTSNQQVESEETAEQEKVYKCDMGPMRRPTSDTETGSSDSDDDEELVFDKDEFDSMFETFKTNRFGLGYKGLDKGNFFNIVGADAPIMQNDNNSLSTFTMYDKNKKKVTIRGQAFGVGAFENDDDDIYAHEDISKYDFRLDSQIEKKSSKSSKITEREFVNGFCNATKESRIAKKHVFKVSLPFSFEPRNWLKRKSRFGPEVAATTSTVRETVGRHDLTPDQRGQLLGDKTKKVPMNDIDKKLQAAGLKTMKFTSGGIENKTNNEQATTSTNDELSLKIDENLTKMRENKFIVPEGIPQIFDRFTSSSDPKCLSELNSNEVKAAPTAPVPIREVKKVTRTKNIWIACQLLCYKMNMETNVGTKPDKGNTFSLFKCIANPETVRRKQLEFAILQQEDSDQVEVKKIEDMSEESEKPTKNVQNSSASDHNEKLSPAPVKQVVQSLPPEPNSKIETNAKLETSIPKRNKPKNDLEMKILNAQDEHPSKKKDIFKAIFDSDNESDKSDEDGEVNNFNVVKKPVINDDVMSTLTKPSSSVTALCAKIPDLSCRNTSPPRGIFSGLTNINRSVETKTSELKSTEETSNEDTSDAYGPSLPPMKPSHSIDNKSNNSIQQAELNSINSISLNKTKVFYEEKWIEKSDEKEKKSKKHKKHKKDGDKHKSKKDKKDKKEKHKKKKR